MGFELQDLKEKGNSRGSCDIFKASSKLERVTEEANSVRFEESEGDRAISGLYCVATESRQGQSRADKCCAIALKRSDSSSQEHNMRMGRGLAVEDQYLNSGKDSGQHRRGGRYPGASLGGGKSDRELRIEPWVYSWAGLQGSSRERSASLQLGGGRRTAAIDKSICSQRVALLTCYGGTCSKLGELACGAALRHREKPLNERRI